VLTRRMTMLLQTLERLLFPARSAGVRYWQKRAARHGSRGVLNLAHAESEAAAVTDRQKILLLPLLEAQLHPDDRLILDFGCGPGRFTPDLARLGGRAIGVDPIEAYLRMAEPAHGVEYRAIVAGRIPLPDASADVVWICLVLGAMPDGAALAAARSEIVRVLRPGGLLFLVENTSRLQNRRHWSFRSVAEYQTLFPSVELRHVTDYEDVGETISVLAGRSRG
jgi:SAM-dependent methyltransferase